MKPWRRWSFRTQIVFATMALTALGMLVVGIGLQLLVHHIVEGNLDRVLQDRSESVVAAVDATSGTTIIVPNGVVDPGDVVFDASGEQVAGAPPARLADEVASLSRVTSRRYVDVGESDRVLAVPFETGAGARGVVVVREPLKPYEQAEWYVGLATLLVGVLVVLAVGAIARWVTSRALAPVAVMAEKAQDWSEHDLTGRFALGPPTNELAALGTTLDGLLDRVATTILAEQRLTSELAHELRTPLASIQGAADLALLRGGLPEDARLDVEQIAASSRVMAETITTLLDLARDPGSFDRSSRLGEVLAGVTGLVPDRITLEDRTGPAAGVRLAAPRDLLVRAVAPLVENAGRYARSRITFEADVAARSVDLRVSDDGPGLAGTADEERADGDGGTGLGLGIARRVARSVGGDVLELDDDGGAVLVVRLPRV
jgi:signal transduction histidine kinase